MSTLTLFTRQRTSSFDHTSRELVWAQDYGYVDVPEYGNHMYQLEVLLQGDAMKYLESNSPRLEEYTYGIRVAGKATWYSINTTYIISCTYMGEIGVVDYSSPEEKLALFQEGMTPLYKLKKLEEGVYSFRLDGTVVIDLNNKAITPPDTWDEDDWEDNSQLLKLLNKILFS